MWLYAEVIVTALLTPCCWLQYAEDPQNLKALYRRGQAYAALQQHAQAAQDLEGSLQLSGHDPQQQQLIREKLQTVREKLAAEQQQPQLQQDTAGAAAKKQEEDGLIEEVQEETDDEMPPLDDDVPELEVIGEVPKQEQQQQPSSSRSAAAQQRAAAASSSSSSGIADAGGLAAMQAQAAELMRANPGLARQVRGMLVAGGWHMHQQQHADRAALRRAFFVDVASVLNSLYACILCYR
jgi:hypothetical protein